MNLGRTGRRDNNVGYLFQELHPIFHDRRNLSALADKVMESKLDSAFLRYAVDLTI